MQTNWYVITGGPSSGKTTTINLLQQRGYKTTIEHARHYIDRQLSSGKTNEELRADQHEFQRSILDMQIAEEQGLDPEEIVFLDRALPDARAYCRFLDLPEDPRLTDVLNNIHYKKIFILDPLPLEKDYARIESQDDQHTLHALLTEVYEALPAPVVHVPVLPPAERVDYILKHVTL